MVAGDSTVRDNRSSENASNGIVTTSGTGSRIDGNQARDNGATGILAGINDIVIRNTAGANATHSIPANFGALQTPNNSTNPLGNIAC